MQAIVITLTNQKEETTFFEDISGDAIETSPYLNDAHLFATSSNSRTEVNLIMIIARLKGFTPTSFMIDLEDKTISEIKS